MTPVHDGIPEFAMPDADEVRRAAESLRLLADPTRIKILWALLQGETSVACLADLAAVTPAVVSQHLAKLRLAGLVKGRREGTFVYYSPTDSEALGVLNQALSGAASEPARR